MSPAYEKCSYLIVHCVSFSCRSFRNVLAKIFINVCFLSFFISVGINISSFLSGVFCSCKTFVNQAFRRRSLGLDTFANENRKYDHRSMTKRLRSRRIGGDIIGVRRPGLSALDSVRTEHGYMNIEREFSSPTMLKTFPGYLFSRRWLEGISESIWHLCPSLLARNMADFGFSFLINRISYLPSGPN